MSNDVKKKRYFIYENIQNIKNHNPIIDLINFKNCKYTENNNGIFLNISVLDEEMIEIIYQLIINSISYDDKTQYEEIKNEEYKKNNIKNMETVKKEKNNKNDSLPLSFFNRKEKEIIKYSKQYNL